MAKVCEWNSINSLATPKICSASSRVGVMMIAPVPFLGLNFNECSISMAGRRKARVLPEPVFAAPSTSLPANRGGIVRACTAVNFVKAILLMALIDCCDKFRSWKVSGMVEESVVVVALLCGMGSVSSASLSRFMVWW